MFGKTTQAAEEKPRQTRTVLEMLQAEDFEAPKPAPSSLAKSQPAFKLALDPLKLGARAIDRTHGFFSEPVTAPSHIPEHLRQHFLSLVQKNGLTLSRLLGPYKDNEEIVLAAIEQNSLALRYASDRLKGDSGVVLSAIWQNAEENRHRTVENIEQTIHNLIRSVSPLYDSEDIKRAIQTAAQVPCPDLDEGNHEIFEQALNKAVASKLHGPVNGAASRATPPSVSDVDDLDKESPGL
jgi:hypothetical protein